MRHRGYVGPSTDNDGGNVFVRRFSLAATLRNSRNTEILTRSSGTTTPTEPAKLIAPMIEHFMASDRAFAKVRRNAAQPLPGSAERSG
ncbi:DUF2274 domain-containing protein [Bradyrhizobium sp. CCGUVB1N3]|nr:DUF2274 domain-containing protein [Bradyrhizobium sp. CCGUVB1N3]MCP3472261.1 DUF2274 domain-containing protein [Bradyrhizobium sp. CCGUVB1N3]